MNKSDVNRLKSTAYHEAGHAVAALSKNIPITEVTIVEKDDSWGDCLHTGVMGFYHQDMRQRKQIARDCIIVSYAGLQAEMLFNPDADKNKSQEDDSNAFYLSRQWCVLPRSCRCVGDDAHWNYLHRLQREAHRLVKRHWIAIVAVAEALLGHKTLTGDEVSKIYQANSKRR